MLFPLTSTPPPPPNFTPLSLRIQNKKRKKEEKKNFVLWLFNERVKGLFPVNVSVSGSVSLVNEC